MKDDGTNNPAYDFPCKHDTIHDVIKHSRMSSDAGECFRLLYQYATNGSYDMPRETVNIVGLCGNFNGLIFDAMQALYRHGHGDRNTLLRDIQKAQFFILLEHKRYDEDARYSEYLDNAVIIINRLLAEVEKMSQTFDKDFKTTWHNQFSEEVGLLNEKIRAMGNDLSPEQSQYENLLMNALIIMDYRPETNEHQTARTNIYKALGEFYEEPATHPGLEDLEELLYVGDDEGLYEVGCNPEVDPLNNQLYDLDGNPLPCDN